MTAMEELVQLRLDVDKCKSELREQPSVCDYNDYDSLKVRRVLQIQLDALVLQLAELEELERIQALQQSAVESGLVVSPVDIDRNEECPLCLEKRTKVTDLPCMACCGAMFCDECEATLKKRKESIISQYYATNNLKQKHQLKHELDMLQRCAFCREPLGDAEHKVSQLYRNVNENKAWAQLSMGECVEEGLLGMKQDTYKAVEWYTLAAEQGNATALYRLSHLWRLGFGKSASKKKAKEHMLRSARLGYPVAQFEVPASESGRDAALTWCSLAAVQGYHAAQFNLGELHMNGEQHGLLLPPPGTDKASKVAALYWFRKAALQGHAHAQKCLASALISVKSEIYEGPADIPGHSAIPEACFWFGLYEETMQKSRQAPIKRPAELQISFCACCHEPRTAGITIQRCGKCKGAGYCGKECQARHWKLGHKLDCAKVAKLKTTMKNVDGILFVGPKACGPVHFVRKSGRTR
jgi:TPR repeat protein